jgi:hypothetical protein
MDPEHPKTETDATKRRIHKGLLVKKPVLNMNSPWAAKQFQKLKT